jgi:hypothetical protein
MVLKTVDGVSWREPPYSKEELAELDRLLFTESQVAATFLGSRQAPVDEEQPGPGSSPQPSTKNK